MKAFGRAHRTTAFSYVIEYLQIIYSNNLVSLFNIRTQYKFFIPVHLSPIAALLRCMSNLIAARTFRAVKGFIRRRQESFFITCMNW